MFQGTFCTRCGQRQRGPNHVCQPSAIERFQRNLAWAKKSAQAHRTGTK